MKRVLFGGLIAVMATASLLSGNDKTSASDYKGTMCLDKLESAIETTFENNPCAWTGPISGDLIQPDHHNLEDRALGYISGMEFQGKKSHDRKGLFVPGAYVWGYLDGIKLGPEKVEYFGLKDVKNFPNRIDIFVDEGSYFVKTNVFGDFVGMNVLQNNGGVLNLKFIGKKAGIELNPKQIKTMLILANNIWQLTGKENMSRLDRSVYPLDYSKQLEHTKVPLR